MTARTPSLAPALLRVLGSVAVAVVGIGVLVSSWPAASPRLAEAPSGPRTETVYAGWTPRHAIARATVVDPPPADPRAGTDPRPGGPGEPISDPPPGDRPPPGPPVDPAPALVFRSIVVREDDSLWKIAERELGDGVRYVDIERWNPQIGGRVLQPGMKLRLQVPAGPGGGDPGRSAEPPVPERTVREHTVARGENLTRIARRYGTTAEAIFDANRGVLDSPHRVQAGIVLRIPEGRAP